MGYRKIPYSTPLTLRFFNPMFNDMSSYSFPMTFNSKLHAINRAFGFPGKIDAEMKKEIEGRITTKFVDLLGSWRVTEAGEGIEAYFTPGSGDFYCRIKDKLLTGIDFGGVRWPVGDQAGWSAILAHLNTKMDVSYPESEYACFSAYMPNAKNVNSEHDATFVNAVTLPEEGDMGFADQFGNTSVYLFIGTVIDFLFYSNGYKIEENVFRTDEDLKRAVVFNTFNLNPPEASEFYNKARIDFQMLLPRIPCSDFLKAVRNRFNIGFFINEQQKSVRILSFDSIAGGRSTRCKTRPKKFSISNNRITGLSFSNTSPDEYGKDNSDQNPFILGTTPEEMIQLSSIPSMYYHTRNEEYIYWEGLSRMVGHADVAYLVPRCDLEGNGYEQPYAEYPLMFLFARGIQNCSVSSGHEDPDPIQQYASMAAFPYPGSTGIRYLAINTGYFYEWNGAYVRIADPEPLPASPPAYTYPMGTGDIYNATGGQLEVNLSMQWGGEYGLIKRYWLKRFFWETSVMKLVKTDMLSKDTGNLIDMSEWKRIGDSNYLVNSFGIIVEGKNVRIQDVELLRL